MVKRKRAGERTRARSKKRAAKRASGRHAKVRSVRKAAGKKTPGGHPSRKRKRASRSRREDRSDSGIGLPGAAGGLGPEAGGQSGDTEGISRSALADSESVEELLEEGQAFEAGIISGVEDAPNADEGGVRTREVPEDDVPQEYLDED